MMKTTYFLAGKGAGCQTARMSAIEVSGERWLPDFTIATRTVREITDRILLSPGKGRGQGEGRKKAVIYRAVLNRKLTLRVHR
jgi:hypothetical protein